VPSLKPWYAVAIPHEDIRESRLDEAIFAANLWGVRQNNAPEIYLDPEAFFGKTFLTAGLSKVMQKVSCALSGTADAGDRMISLQTAFGGGKTHTQVALWHLAKHPDKIRKSPACAYVRKVLGEELPKRVKGVAVFTNQTCDPTQGRKTPEGVTTRTLWGELALQLGGVELYRDIEPNDRARTVPKGLFTDIFRKAAPCLILLDELADYCMGASAIEIGAVTLADLAISFVQELTEAAHQVPGVAIVATLPASHLEVASTEKGQEILNRLERRFGRMSADIKPVADEEIYEVVRRRLFESLGDAADHEAVVNAYLKMYQAHKNEVPVDAARGTYKDRIVASYPFHPALIDALYLRWGSHSDFQRTRGVLRLLASIVGDLWQRRKTSTQSQPLIQPCHVRWTIDALHAALTRLWGAAYESVVAADVIGDKANAVILDAERGGEYPQEHISEGLAAAILLGSFGGQGERAGYSTKDLKQCAGRPDLNWGYTDGALLGLEDRAFYVHTASAGNQGKRYWFGTKPTLTKLLVQYRNQFAAQSFDAEIIEALQKQVKDLKIAPATWRVLVNPGADLPEQKSLTLLVMPPDCPHVEEEGGKLLASATEQRILGLSEKCGTKDRHYRNTLLFLLPSPRGLTRLRNALREVVALEAVRRDYAGQLDEEQRAELKEKLDKAREGVGEAVGSAYTTVARIEGQKVASVTLSEVKVDLGSHLQTAWKQLLDEDEWILRKVGTVTLQSVGLVPTEDGIRIKDCIEAFLRYTDKPMIATREAVVQGLAQACKEGIIGIARGVSLAKLQAKWCGETVDIDPAEDGLWVIPPFTKEEKPVTTGDEGDGGGEHEAKGDKKGPTTTGKDGGGDSTSDNGGVKVAKQVRRVTIKGDVPMESWADVFRCFVNPAVRLSPKQLRLGIDFEIELSAPLAEDHGTLKAMREAARQFGLELEEE
jgi:hypothetical protein